MVTIQTSGDIFRQVMYVLCGVYSVLEPGPVSDNVTWFLLWSSTAVTT